MLEFPRRGNRVETRFRFVSSSVSTLAVVGHEAETKRKHISTSEAFIRNE
jgi:hypothetical protein